MTPSLRARDDLGPTAGDDNSLTAMNAEKGDDWRAQVGVRDNPGRVLDLGRAREPGRGRDVDSPEQILPLDGRISFGGCYGRSPQIVSCPPLAASPSLRSLLSPCTGSSRMRARSAPT